MPWAATTLPAFRSDWGCGGTPLSARGAPQAAGGLVAQARGTADVALLSSRGFATTGPLSARNGRVVVPLLPGNGGLLEHPATPLVPKCSAAFSDKLGGRPKLSLDVVAGVTHHTRRYASTRTVTHDERNAMKESARNTYAPAILPTWLKHDRQVLRFAAYFKEPVHENPRENFKVRHCTIYFYLEDSTMMVCEPRVENSGLAQGTFVKRHRIPKVDGSPFTFEDFAGMGTITVYSRVFQLCDCDEFTRQFYRTAMGVEMPDKQEPPLDGFTLSRIQGRSTDTISKGMLSAQEHEFAEISAGGSRRNAKLQQYLENDRRVLRFQAFWDDPTKYGARMYYTVLYYLADDTVEILERLARNSGRDPYPVFWRRSELKKAPHINPVPGMLEPFSEICKPEDFFVGDSVNVYGREIFLYDCDDFTRDFYRGYMAFEQAHIEIKDPELVHVKLNVPPHVGIGDEIDSFTNCTRLRPKPPKRDFEKLMRESDIFLRFRAKMADAAAEDVARRFIVTVFLADDSLAVFEERRHNSGFVGGKFAAKSRKKNPATGTWFTATEFFLGALVEISANLFELIGSDDATLKTMEARCAEFPMADRHSVMAKATALKGALSEGCDEVVDAERLRNFARQAGADLSLHEAVTLLRMVGEVEASSLRGGARVDQLLAVL